MYVLSISGVYVYQLASHPKVEGGDIKVKLISKPNLVHNLLFIIYTRVYYINTHSWVLTRNVTSEPRVRHIYTHDS